MMAAGSYWSLTTLSESGSPNYHPWLATRAAISLGNLPKCAFSPTMRQPRIPAVIEAIAQSNRLDTAYDGDALSQKLDGAFSELFETEVRAFWVRTGTAANCLALAALCPPYGAIICHRDAHIEVDEAGAPAFFADGAKLMLVDGPGRKGRAGSRRCRGRAHPQGRAPGTGQGAVDHQCDRIRPHLFGGRGRLRSARPQSGTALPSTWTARASPTPLSAREQARRTSAGAQASMPCPSAS